MSVERSFEAWEEVQRHGQDFADRLAQGFTGLIHSHIPPPSFPWPNPPNSKLFDLEFPGQSFGIKDYGLTAHDSIFDIGSRIGQASADFGACLNGVVQQFFRQLPMPFWPEENVIGSIRMDRDKSWQRDDIGVAVHGNLGTLTERLRSSELADNDAGSDAMVDDEASGFDLKAIGHLGRAQSTINISSTYDSRSRDVESSLVARGDLWRVEASHGRTASGNDNSSLFLLQLGPVLFVRDSTLLLPVHLSKQHLLWYGYDRKNGMHSLCPAVWSKHRRWLFMSMLRLNPPACSFVDLQFPNGQLTYVSGEGLTTTAFLPFCGGLLQAQGQYPGEMRFSFCCKNKWGTRITPMVQFPDKSFTLDLAQSLAWKRTGLLVKPTLQCSLSSTFGGSNPGVRAEIVHSVKEHLNLMCGCSSIAHPSAFASISIGRSKWNGNVGNSGIVVRVDAPLSNIRRTSFSVQINTGIEC
ncbi:hypothetical protein SDJN02_01081 [Cucurbita argyrosperma subsp. argyrosperma]|nr:hypothetical protein SDJN02_01081 [Cucurbita argyrosperma subsp. argyrosperma]